MVYKGLAPLIVYAAPRAKIIVPRVTMIDGTPKWEIIIPFNKPRAPPISKTRIKSKNSGNNRFNSLMNIIEPGGGKYRKKYPMLHKVCNVAAKHKIPPTDKSNIPHKTTNVIPTETVPKIAL